MASQDNSAESRLQEVIASFLEATVAGQTPDRAQLLAAHPDLADDLRAFFADHDKMTQAAAPVRDALGDAPQSETFPQTFGDYELLEEIGRGGMGIVYKARQVSLNRIVALKRIRAGQLATQEEVARFRREAEAAAALDHPHIVPIYEVGEQGGQHYFTMKLIEGGNLNAHLARFADAKATAELMIKIALAVHHAHQRGILHRDLKPGNILIDADGNPHVSDFGLAQPIEKEAKLTQSGAILGTPEYMAPEQARGEKGLTTAADVYGLGAILYVLLTGKPPFQGDFNWETLKKVVEEEPVLPRSLNRQANWDLEAICLMCLEKLPSKRYGSAEALAADLQGWLEGKPILARRARLTEHLWKWARRHPTRATLLVAATSLAVLAIVSFFQWRDLGVQTTLAINRKVALAAEEKLRKEREWFLLLNRAKAERLNSRRSQALAHLKELADLTRAKPDVGDPALLHEEAFLAINTPEAHLLREMDVGFLRSPTEYIPTLVLSPDGSHLLVHAHKDGWTGIWCVSLGNGKAVVHKGSPELLERLHSEDRLFIDRRRFVGEKTQIVKWSDDGKRVHIGPFVWDPFADKNLEGPAVDAKGYLLRKLDAQGFLRELNDLLDDVLAKHAPVPKLLASPQGGWQAAGDCYWKAADADAIKKKVPGAIARFLSETRLLAEKKPSPDDDFKQKLVLFVWNLEQEKIEGQWHFEKWEFRPPSRVLLWRSETVDVLDLVEKEGLWAPIERSFGYLGRKDEFLLTLEKSENLRERVCVRDLNANTPWNEPMITRFHPNFAHDLRAASVSWNGRWMVTPFPANQSHRSNRFRAFDLLSGESNIPGDHGENHAPIEFAPNSNLLLTHGNSPGEERSPRSMRIWDLYAQTSLLKLANPSIAKPVVGPDNFNRDRFSVGPVWSANGRVLAVSCPTLDAKGRPWGEGIRAWRIIHPNPTYPGNAARRLEFSSDGQWLAINDERWKVVRGGDLALLQPPLIGKQASQVNFGRQGKSWEVRRDPSHAMLVQETFLAGKKWKLPNEDKEGGQVGFGRHVVAISPHGKVAVVDHGAMVNVWDLTGASPVMIWSHACRKWNSFDSPFGYTESPFQRIIFANDDSFMIRSLEGSELAWSTFHIPTRKCQDHLDETATVVFPSAAAVRKITGDRIDFSDGRLPVRLQGNWSGFEPNIMSYSFDGMKTKLPRPIVLSPDERMLAFQDGAYLHVCDVKSGQILLRWKAHEELITALAFSPDCSLLATGDRRGVKLWNLDFIWRERVQIGLPPSWPGF